MSEHTRAVFELFLDAIATQGAFFNKPLLCLTS